MPITEGATGLRDLESSSCQAAHVPDDEKVGMKPSSQNADAHQADKA